MSFSRIKRDRKAKIKKKNLNHLAQRREEAFNKKCSVKDLPDKTS